MGIRRYSTTFTGNGSSTAFRVDPEEAQGGTVKVSFTLAGTWNSATATLMKCDDPNISPLSYTAVTSGAYTANAADTWDIPVGTVFRVTVTGAGSPIPSIVFRLTGYITPI